MTVYRTAPAAGDLIAAGVGRTAVAVRGLPDSSLVHRLTRGRLWIAVLGALLIGIVALNVLSLGLTSTSGRVEQRIEALERQNSVLRSGIAERLSAESVEGAAAALGLAVADPTEITYLSFSASDVDRAAMLLAGEIVAAAAAPEPEPGIVPPSPAPSPDPAPPPQAPPAQGPPAPATAPSPGGSGSSDGGDSGGIGAGL